MADFSEECRTKISLHEALAERRRRRAGLLTEEAAAGLGVRHRLGAQVLAGLDGRIETLQHAGHSTADHAAGSDVLWESISPEPVTTSARRAHGGGLDRLLVPGLDALVLAVVERPGPSTGTPTWWPTSTAIAAIIPLSSEPSANVGRMSSTPEPKQKMSRAPGAATCSVVAMPRVSARP